MGGVEEREAEELRAAATKAAQEEEAAKAHADAAAKAQAEAAAAAMAEGALLVTPRARQPDPIDTVASPLTSPRSFFS